MKHFFEQHSAAPRLGHNSANDEEDGEEFCDEIFLEMGRKIQKNVVI